MDKVFKPHESSVLVHRPKLKDPSFLEILPVDGAHPEETGTTLPIRNKEKSSIYGSLPALVKHQSLLH